MDSLKVYPCTKEYTSFALGGGHNSAPLGAIRVKIVAANRTINDIMDNCRKEHDRYLSSWTLRGGIVAIQRPPKPKDSKTTSFKSSKFAKATHPEYE